MPYFCTLKQCGYIWDSKGRTRKKARCPKCRTRKTLYINSLYLNDIKNFIKRGKQYLADQEKQAQIPEKAVKTPRIYEKRDIPELEKPEGSPNCWGRTDFIEDSHCRYHCPDKRSCRLQRRYQDQE